MPLKIQFDPYQFPSSSDYKDFFYLFPDEQELIYKLLQEEMKELRMDLQQNLYMMQNNYQQERADRMRWFQEEVMRLYNNKSLP